MRRYSGWNFSFDSSSPRMLVQNWMPLKPLPMQRSSSACEAFGSYMGRVPTGTKRSGCVAAMSARLSLTSFASSTPTSGSVQW